MYSPLIIEKRLAKAKKDGRKFVRLPRSQSIEISASLEPLTQDDRGKPLEPGHLRRDLTPRERDFISSEQLLCKCDFEYYFTRYHTVELDPGVSSREDKIGAPVLAESQRRYIKLFGQREETCHTEQAKYKFTKGILAYIHKCRQVMATATVRGMTIHRMLFWPGTRAFAGSLDETRIGELFTRDQLTIANLPWWLRPTIYPNVKNVEIGFEFPISSRISYQAENAQTGIGTGAQNDVSHLTETALWKYPGRIDFSFIPSIPKAITTLHVQESTAELKGYWYEVTEKARHKHRGYEDWIYAFIPWYMNRLKYRGNPPDDWRPAETTIKHAELIERSSPEFFDGITIHPTREQLYWWESERARHVANGDLRIFLTNYPATPEQSFQNNAEGALPVELLEFMEQETMGGIPYDVEVGGASV